jgi:DNA-binding CsgD family transcriptional regulator
MEAFEYLSRSDADSSLGAEDLELLAMAAYMIGRDDDYVHGLERAHQAHLEDGAPLRAARCAFWAGLCLLFRDEPGRANGWFGRMQRLIEREAADCVERGYLLLTVAEQHDGRGDLEAWYSVATEAVQIAERYRDSELHACAIQEQGRALVRMGKVEEGLGLLDEVMLAVTAGELSPIVTGLMYCSIIDGCQQAHALRRAREWTAALSRWCEQQPEMVSFTGRCLIHRAEIMQLHGSWRDALVEAERARERSEEGANPGATGEALYRQGELHRLRGESEEAEDAYRGASRCGREPQPGLALLRLGQGRAEAAAAALRRLRGETTGPVERAALLPAHVEVMLAVDALDEAREACRELAAIAGDFRSEMLRAAAAQARGAVELAEGNAQTALGPLRQALQILQELDVPYEIARARVLIAHACRALGDEDSAALELEAAREVFDELGAAPDVETVDTLARGRAGGDTHGLTARELEVLRLVAAGETNKAIAARLVISERTVDRHVSNILAKVGAPSRAAATAYAYEHQLV